MNQFSDTDRGWVAGMFEGEGSVWAAITTRGRRPQVRVRISQNDRTMCERLQKVTGVGRITGPYYQGASGGRWDWTVNKQADVGSFLTTIEGLLSDRRQHQIGVAYSRRG